MQDSLRILVLGGYGLIGQPIMRRLVDDGHLVSGLGRDVALGRSWEPGCDWIEADIAKLVTPDLWAPILSRFDVVVNASGALQSGSKDCLADLQERAIGALVEACEKHGPRRLIQISAPGAVVDASTEFLRTKAVADTRLRASSLDWVILRPGLVVSPDAYGGTALVRMLASLPFVLPLVHASAPVATVDVAEIVEAVVLSIKGGIPGGSDIEIAETHPRSLESVVLEFRSWLGLARPRAVVAVPGSIGTLVGRFADMLGHLGWRSPLRTTALSVMQHGVTADPTTYMRLTGRTPLPLEKVLRRYPATVQERWFGRTYLLLPLMIATLSLFWMASGAIGLIEIGQAARHLSGRGIPEPAASIAVAAGGLVDLALGTLVLFRAHVRMACLGMMAVTAAYLLAGTIGAPELWADPLGPYVKTVPAAVLAGVVAALMGGRR